MFQLRDPIGIEFALRLRTLARKRQVLSRATGFSKSPTAWDSADTCEPPPPYVIRSRSRASQPSSIHGNILVGAPVLFSSIQFSWPLIACLTFGAHSI